MKKVDEKKKNKWFKFQKVSVDQETWKFIQELNNFILIGHQHFQTYWLG